MWVTYGMGRGRGWMRRDGATAGEKGKGHWRLSSVSDRENAVTTSSAPEKPTGGRSLLRGSRGGVTIFPSEGCARGGFLSLLSCEPR